MAVEVGITVGVAVWSAVAVGVRVAVGTFVGTGVSTGVAVGTSVGFSDKVWSATGGGVAVTGSGPVTGAGVVEMTSTDIGVGVSGRASLNTTRGVGVLKITTGVGVGDFHWGTIGGLGV